MNDLLFNKKILIANRGEIACRIIKTCKTLNVKTVAIYSEIDRAANHVILADEAVCISSNSPSESYLDQEKIIAAAINTQCHGIIPGYGFLSENSDFATACEKAGITFIGPTADTIIQFGLKHIARSIAQKANLPIVSGSKILESVDEAVSIAETIGYPVLLKCSGGGGGIGMQLCASAQEVKEKFKATQKMGKLYFNNSDIYLEKYISSPRHIEVQVFGDGNGKVVALGERECSIQRRFQKVLEESPSAFVDEDLRQKLFQSAIALCQHVNYRSAGTVECLVDGNTKDYYFLETNTRLQVEHPVTEEVTGLDLVEWMIRLAFDNTFSIQNHTHFSQGHSIEVRVYAEDPVRDFLPGTGTITDIFFPDYPWARYDFGVKQGSEVSSCYDSMLGKVIVFGKTRRQAIERLQRCLLEFKLAGITSNLSYLKDIVNSPAFASNDISTEFLNEFVAHSPSIEVLKPGFLTTVQDYPGRTNYWKIGVPPSGPVDHLALQTANALVGNQHGASALELTLEGPTLLFHSSAIIAFAGAEMQGDIDGRPIEWYSQIFISAGSTLSLQHVKNNGFRSYMAIRDGFDLPEYLGSQSTFCFGQFGGLHGSALKTGDSLPFFSHTQEKTQTLSLPKTHRPTYSKEWEIGVIYGPHGAPDFFTEEDIDMFFSSSWKVHHNSNRLGIRLKGQKPTWARKDGGEAGLHPSNIHDCEYAIGTINFTGDMPIILNCDGPSLGGFVCPATIVHSEIWKLGQISANDTIRFRRMSYEQALLAKQSQFEYLEGIQYGETNSLPTLFGLSNAVPEKLTYDKFHTKTLYSDPIVHSIEASAHSPQIIYRIAGDNYLLIEYGPLELDLNVRFRVHALEEWIKNNPVKGILELSPGVRSIQVHYDSSRLHLRRLLEILTFAETQLPDVNDMEIPSRIIRLPFAFDDKWNKEAVKKYRQSIKDKAPYLPDNIDFITRINGLDNKDQVRDSILDASYLVLGLGDVYLGAPCAVPIDPRHRLVTSKYNPARTYTPEGSVGIGGVYMCIYGMDSPGGYQLVGRTLPIWNKFVNNPYFESGKPWLLRFFDQVQYYLVEDDELEEMREQFALGRFAIDVEETVIKPKEINQFLHSIEKEVATFKTKQQAAFDKERQHWEESGMIGGSEEELLDEPSNAETKPIPEGCIPVHAHTSGVIWDVLVSHEEEVANDKPLIILESMKTEIPINYSGTGKIHEIAVKKGQLVNQGDLLCVIEEP